MNSSVRKNRIKTVEKNEYAIPIFKIKNAPLHAHKVKPQKSNAYGRTASRRSIKFVGKRE